MALQTLRTLTAIQPHGQESEHMSQSLLKLADLLKLSNSKISESQPTSKESS